MKHIALYIFLTVIGVSGCVRRGATESAGTVPLPGDESADETSTEVFAEQVYVVELEYTVLDIQLNELATDYDIHLLTHHPAEAGDSSSRALDESSIMPVDALPAERLKVIEQWINQLDGRQRVLRERLERHLADEHSYLPEIEDYTMYTIPDGSPREKLIYVQHNTQVLSANIGTLRQAFDKHMTDYHR